MRLASRSLGWLPILLGAFSCTPLRSLGNDSNALSDAGMSQDSGSSPDSGSDGGRGQDGGVCTGSLPSGLIDDAGLAYVFTPNQDFISVWSTPDAGLTKCGVTSVGAHIGQLDILSLCDGSRASVSMTADPNSVAFSAATTFVAFIDGLTDECSTSGYLEVANADGSGLRRVGDAGEAHVTGQMILFGAAAGGVLDATPLAGGAILSTGYEWSQVDSFRPDGTALVAYSTTTNPHPTWVVENTLSGATTVLIDGSTESAPLAGNPGGSSQWTPDGATLAFMHGPSATAQQTSTVSLFDATGGSRTDLPHAATPPRMAFSPDGTKLAYPMQNADGTYSVVIHTVANGQEAVLPGIPAPAAGYIMGTFWWSADSAYYLVDVYNTSLQGPDDLWIASPSLGLLKLSNQYAFGLFVSFTPADDYVAYSLVNGTVAIAALPTGDITASPSGGFGVYSSSPSGSPLLLYPAGFNGSLSLLAKDGSGTPIVLPGPLATVSSPSGAWASWIGPSRILYLQQAGTSSSLVSSDELGNTQVIATEVVGALDLSVTPSRFFYRRDTSANPLNAGLWMLNL